MKWFINRNWSINWIAAILVINILWHTHLQYYSSLSEFLERLSFWDEIYMVILGAAMANFGYGFTLLLQKLIKRGGKFRSWVFIFISVPLTTGLSVSFIDFLFGLLSAV